MLSRLALVLVTAAGCSDALNSEEDIDLADQTDEETDTPPSPPSPTLPSLAAQVEFMQGCDDRRVAFDARVTVDGEESSATCSFAFDDGTVVEGCRGVHVFEAAGIYTSVLTVRHDSGAVAQVEERVIVYDPFTLDVEVAAPQCGLTFTFTPSYAPDIDSLVSLVTPAENVIRQEGLAGVVTVEVQVAGTYEVTVIAEDERIGPICSKTVTKSVTLSDCPCHH